MVEADDQTGQGEFGFVEHSDRYDVKAPLDGVMVESYGLAKSFIKECRQQLLTEADQSGLPAEGVTVEAVMLRAIIVQIGRSDGDYFF